MRNAAGQAAPKIPEDGRKIAMRVALMEEYRLASRGREFQLCDEGRALCIRRREITVIVQAAFAGRNHLGPAQEVGQFRAMRRIEALGMVGVYAGGTRQKCRVRGRQRRRLARTCHIGTGDDLVPYAGLERACHHRVTILCKAVVGKIRPNID